MPVTALLLPDIKNSIPGATKKIKFVTQDSKEHLIVDIYECNEDWIEIGKPTEGTHIDNEEEYHTLLRLEASKRGHFVSEQSTDPHWNPNYKEDIFKITS